MLKARTGKIQPHLPTPPRHNHLYVFVCLLAVFIQTTAPTKLSKPDKVCCIHSHSLLQSICIQEINNLSMLLSFAPFFFSFTGRKCKLHVMSWLCWQSLIQWGKSTVNVMYLVKHICLMFIQVFSLSLSHGEWRKTIRSNK